MTRTGILRFLTSTTGIISTLIGLYHLLLGNRSVIGVERDRNPNVDSQTRFYGGMFAGYGPAWLWASRQKPIPSSAVRFLAATMAAGGAGRIVSMSDYGAPHPFWKAMTAVELAVPAAVFAVADADASAGEEAE